MGKARKVNSKTALLEKNKELRARVKELEALPAPLQVEAKEEGRPPEIKLKTGSLTREEAEKQLRMVQQGYQGMSSPEEQGQLEAQKKHVRLCDVKKVNKHLYNLPGSEVMGEVAKDCVKIAIPNVYSEARETVVRERQVEKEIKRLEEYARDEITANFRLEPKPLTVSASAGRDAIEKEAMERFARSGKISVGLNHPNFGNIFPQK